MAGLFRGPGTGHERVHREESWRRIAAAGGLALGALLLAFATLGWAVPPTAEARPAGAAVRQGEPGGFAVAVKLNGEWQEVAELTFGYVAEERVLDLPVDGGEGEIAIRLEHTGNTPAHIDAVTLDGRAPLTVGGAAEDEALALRKLAAQDFDLVDAQGRTLVLRFDGGDVPLELSLTARIQPPSVPKTPFQFPIDNLYQTIDSTSTFFTYDWDSNTGSLEIDGDLAGEGLGTPLFKTTCEPGTGHPTGDTVGWVRNDAETLYVALDFTPDNTMDGDADYAKVYVRTADGVEVFKVSTAELVWGTPGFTYTERVGYQHKVYEFAIPRSAFESGMEDADSLALAFGAYGTVSPQPEVYPGPEDPSFSGDGMVTKTIARADTAYDLALQSTGKSVLGGACGDMFDYAFCLARFGSDGLPDGSFGTGGAVTTSLGSWSVGRALALKQDDSIVLAGTAEYGGRLVFALARYDEHGTLDHTFGSGGVATRTIGSDDADCYGLDIQPDGKLLAVGTSDEGTDLVLTVARFQHNGAPDLPFGTNGVVTTAIGSQSIARGVVVQLDGKILAVGSGQHAHSSTFAMTRYLADGTPDASFGVNGVITTDVSTGSSSAYAVALWQDKILVAGEGLDGGHQDFALARYHLSDGSLDTGFGTGGIVTTDFGSEDRARDVVVEDNGDIVVAGTNYEWRIALARYLPTGILDAHFGQKGGRVNTRIEPAGGDAGEAVALQADGRILVAGSASSAMGGSDFALVRYARDLSMDATVSPVRPESGGVVRYRLAFRNDGAVTGNVNIVNQVPLGFSPSTIVNSGVPITLVQPGPPTYRWTVGILGYGQGGMITMTGRVPFVSSEVTLTDTARIQTPDWDNDRGNNIDSAVMVVVPKRIYLPLVLRQ